MDDTATEELYVAGGCLWGVQAFVETLPGVVFTEAGRANGTSDSLDGDYDGYAECVRIRIDLAVVSVDRLMTYLFEIIDPYSVNRQGPDVGEKYRTGLYSENPEHLDLARAFIAARDDAALIAVEVLPLTNYVRSADEHQDRLARCPDDSCHLPRELLDKYRVNVPTPDLVVLTGRLVCTTADEAERVRRHLPAHVALTRAEPGCLAFDVEPTDDPLVWSVSERFVDRAAFDAHQERVTGSAWAEATAGITRDYVVSEREPLGVGAPVPVLRMFDEAAAREFYVDYLRFDVQWEHRFEPDLPLYMRIRRGSAVLDLSEHHGDGTPGSVVWIPIVDADAFHADLGTRPHRRLRPGIDRDAPGGPTIQLTDPSGNELRFCESAE
jgi:peptide-methionine (S)-S-oxide reductase